MNDKLTNEQCEKILKETIKVMEMEVLRQSDAVELLDVLLNACRREKAEIEDWMKPSDILQ